MRLQMYLYIVLCLFNFSFAAINDEKRVLTLEESIDIALNESYRIRRSKNSLALSELRREAEKDRLKTKIDMYIDAPDITQEIKPFFNSVTGKEEFYDIQKTSSSANIEISQPILFTNGTMRVSGSLRGVKQVSGSEDYYSDLRLSLDQPIFTFNRLKADLARVEIQQEQAVRNFSKAQQDLIYETTREFYQLYQAKLRFQIAEESMKQKEESFALIEAKKNNNTLTANEEVDLLNSEVELAESKSNFIGSKQRYDQAKQRFLYTIGLDFTEDIDIKATITFQPVKIDFEKVLQNALSNRLELINIQNDIEMNQMDVERIEADGNVTVSIKANYGINKYDGKFGDVFNNFRESRGVKLSFRLPVLDWGRNDKLVQVQQIELGEEREKLKDQIKSIRLEITRLYDELVISEEKVKIAQKSVLVAEKSYNLSLERFNASKISSFELSQAQKNLERSKETNLQALIDYKVRLAQLEKEAMMRFNNDIQPK